MNLTIVTETFAPEINGVAMTFGHVARELARRGHHVLVCRPRRSDSDQSGPADGFEDWLMAGLPIPGYPQLRLGLPAHRAFRRRWREQRPDLVHVVTEGPLGASAVTVARELGIPLTSSFHTNFHAYARHYRLGPLRGLALAWLRRVHNRTLRTFAPTAELCEELMAAGFLGVTLMSRGVDTEQFSPAHRSDALRASWGAGPEDTVVVHVGRLAAEKNYPLLFQCFDAIRAANPRTVFVIVGDGPLRANLQRTNPGVHFTGFVSPAQLARVYASADLYLHASLTETFGNVLTEAMASGLAVVAFDYAAAREFIRHDVNGLAIPRAEPAVFVSAAIALASSPERIERLRRAARGRLVEQSWSRVIAQFEADLLGVLVGPTRCAEAAA